MYILTVNMYIIHESKIIGHNKEETGADVPPEQSLAPSIIRHNIEIGPSPQIELEIKMANAGQTDLVSLIYPHYTYDLYCWDSISQLRSNKFRSDRKCPTFIRLRILLFLISVISTDFWRSKVPNPTTSNFAQSL